MAAMAARSGAALGALGVDLPGPGSPGQNGTGRDSAADDSGTETSAAGEAADLSLQVTLAEGCDPAAATAAVRRVAEALLTATGGRLRRGMEISLGPARAG